MFLKIFRSISDVRAMCAMLPCFATDGQHHRTDYRSNTCIKVHSPSSPSPSPPPNMGMVLNTHTHTVFCFSRIKILHCLEREKEGVDFHGGLSKVFCLVEEKTRTFFHTKELAWRILVDSEQLEKS